jgi:hypothetical protein
VCCNPESKLCVTESERERVASEDMQREREQERERARAVAAAHRQMKWQITSLEDINSTQNEMFRNTNIYKP